MPNLAEFKSKYPEISQAVFDEGHAEGLKANQTEAIDEGFKTGLAQGRTQGAETERDRIKAVEDQLIPGHEALIETLKFDGSTTGEQAAVKVLQSEKTMRADLAQKLKNDAPDPVPHAPAPENNDPKDPKAIWDQDESLRAEFSNDFDKYSAFTKAEAAGQIRIVSRK